MPLELNQLDIPQEIVRHINQNDEQHTFPMLSKNMSGKQISDNKNHKSMERAQTQPRQEKRALLMSKAARFDYRARKHNTDNQNCPNTNHMMAKYAARSLA